MKKMMFCLVLLSLMSACKKTPSFDCNSPTKDLGLCKELIIGKWEWVRTVRQFDTFAISTPKTAGQTVSLNFKTNGIVETFVNGQFKDTSSFEIYDAVKYSKIDSGLTFLRFREFGWVTPRDVLIKVCEDSLFLPYEATIYHTGNKFYSKIK
jgi:hypothetical protein